MGRSYRHVIHRGVQFRTHHVVPRDAADPRPATRSWEAPDLRAARDTSDAQLVEALLQGDSGALAKIYERHGDTCFALARRVLNDGPLAEEVIQELFVRLWRTPERFDPERGTLRSFLLAQVHGRSVDLLRAEVARRGREERDAFRSPAVDDDLERAVLDLTEAETVRAALASLSEAERTPIELAYYGGHTYREVATLLEQPEGTVKSRIRSGLLRLRAALIDAGVVG
ncbi:MAG: polymerase, sigma-24 subunit, subfamily [Actinomycetia bacterium]|nr:polymerase, sigma-24 subunit, subfamily [Actinomycetes bacterium]